MNETRTVTLSEIIPARTHSDQRQQENLFSARGTKIQRTYECTWFRDGPSQGSLPNIIIPADSDLESLFADVATYYPEYSPITAYAYAIDRSFASSLDHVRVRGADPSIIQHRFTADERQRRVAVALAIAETLSKLYAIGRDENDLSYSQCRSSFAFCIARSSTLYPNLDPALVTSKWTLLSEATQIETPVGLPAPIEWISALISNSDRKERTEVDADLRSLAVGSSKPSDFAFTLDQLYPGISSLREGLTGHFDGRVPTFEKVASLITGAGRNRETDALAIAFFANLIQPGSFAHAKLVGRRIERYPSILIWYGFFAAVSQEFDYRRGFAGLGLKLLRDIEVEFELNTRPTTDVSLDELYVLSRIGLNHRSIKPAQKQSLLVSLIPGVNVYTRFSDRTGDSDLAQIDRILKAVSERDQHLKRLLQQAQSLLAGDVREPLRESQRSSKPGRKFRGPWRRDDAD